ncbi:hypothetical protein MMAD_46750 [Mycolicibacterium madagascariense]|uniref:Lipoprotein n=1 Tax=Mycolicibacterium madagascariense TaxID=212765 RepID=A0A7I7XME4_9MYCO|nr:hypothetical protein [Mycolicibacterium madagascariense]MCV7013073.1 hypothetical protein [Mycolicibacterium madagascariense]BBZ30380.1 hypothetical protein MMAD_46750 [Mycolicibacterium madagascariense]
MKKTLAVTMGAWVCAALALAGATGTASAADGVVGETYKHAKSALSKQGKSAHVVATVGDRREWNDCLVVTAVPAPELNAFGKKRGGHRVNLSLNCYASFSTYLEPGYSLESPEGRQMYEEALAKYRAAHAADG